MTKKTDEEINQFVVEVLGHLNGADLNTAKALCRGAYKMGYDHGKRNSTLEVIGAEGIIEAINNNKSH